MSISNTERAFVASYLAWITEAAPSRDTV